MRGKMKRNCLIVFLRFPEAGKVKTRLGAEIGDEAARRLYSCFVLDLLDMLKKAGFRIRIGYDPPSSGEAVASWLSFCGVHFFPQEGEDLGERMKNAFRMSFREGFENAILMGTDCPDLPRERIDEGFRSLAAHDCVIGPACDGGYYLIGFTRRGFLPSAFSGIPWGTGDVLKSTASVLSRAGRSLRLLTPWRDIDTLADLENLAVNGDNGFRKSRTMQYLLSPGGPLSQVRADA